MSVPTVPTVPTSNHKGWNGHEARFSAGYNPAVPTVPTFFYMKEEKEERAPHSTLLCVHGLNNSQYGWNGWNGHQKALNSAPHSRSNDGTVGWNGVGTA